MNYKTALLTLAAIIIGINCYAQEQKEIKLNTFNEVKFEGSAQWVLIPSDEEKVIIESNNKDMFNYIDVDQKKGVLIISTTDKNKDITKLFRSVTITVYFKSIESVSLSGTGAVNTKGKIVSKKLTATLRGAGSMFIETKCSQFEGKMYGTGELEASGTADECLVRVEGVGVFDGYELISTDIDVTVSGIGGAKVNATSNLTATINGVGSITYKGDPSNKNLETNGIGSIKKFKN